MTLFVLYEFSENKLVLQYSIDFMTLIAVLKYKLFLKKINMYQFSVQKNKFLNDIFNIVSKNFKNTVKLPC